MYKIITAAEAFSWPHKTNSIRTMTKFINKTMRKIRKAARAGETNIIVWANSLNDADITTADAFLSNLGYNVTIYEFRRCGCCFHIRWDDKLVN